MIQASATLTQQPTVPDLIFLVKDHLFILGSQVFHLSQESEIFHDLSAYLISLAEVDLVYWNLVDLKVIGHGQASRPSWQVLWQLTSLMSAISGQLIPYRLSLSVNFGPLKLLWAFRHPKAK